MTTVKQVNAEQATALTGNHRPVCGNGRGGYKVVSAITAVDIIFVFVFMFVFLLAVLFLFILE